MKNIKVTDDIHRQLTCILGELMAKTGEPQTFNDVIAELIVDRKKSKENSKTLAKNS